MLRAPWLLLSSEDHAADRSAVLVRRVIQCKGVTDIGDAFGLDRAEVCRFAGLQT